ncbi:MAG: hypothetical protein HYY06_05935 [Deltaproteobacteria bacterium]|nr:hypothetical protein [Deltaproteobacteria bacterium]
MNRARWLWILAPIMGLFGASCVVTTDTCTDTDADTYCDDEDDYPLDGACWLAPDPVCEGTCNDADGDTVCDEFDVSDCLDDLTGYWICDAGCTPGVDNYCVDPWLLDYCAAEDGLEYRSDCNSACTTDDRVYAQTCGGTPAVAGECLDDLGACGCWCEEAFDSCVNDYTVQYTREGTTYQVDCKEYCNGSCDEAAGACAC